MNRKRLIATLLISMAIATLLVLGSAPSKVQGQNAKTINHLIGTWQVTVMPDGGGQVIDYASFAEGGGITNIDPDPALSAGLGTWERVGPNSFANTFVHFLNDHGTPLGIVKVNAVITYDPTTATLSGPFRTDIVIGGEVVQSICGTVELERVTAEPLEACP